MQATLLVAGTLLAGWALRTYSHPIPRKAGALAFLLASYLAGWLLSGSHVAGATAVAAWFFLPWLEILTRVRGLRLPLERRLRSGFPPSDSRFPQLPQLTTELQALGYEPAEDASFEWAGARQFVRLLYHPEERTQAAISLLEQGPMSLVWVSLSSRSEDGCTWTTWNYPFSQTMKLPPEVRVRHAGGVGSFAELREAHQGFLRDNGVSGSLAAQDPEAFVDRLQFETRRQVDHNLDAGLIKLSGEGTFRYSWRGYLFLWRQFLRDLVRLS